MSSLPRKSKSRGGSAQLDVLRIGQAAEQLGLSVLQVDALIGEGKMPAINVGTVSRPAWRVPAESMERYKAGQAVSDPEAGQ